MVSLRPEVQRRTLSMMMATLDAHYGSHSAAWAACEVQAAVLQQIGRRMDNIPNHPEEVHNARALLLESATAIEVYVTKMRDYEEKAAQYNTLKTEYDAILLEMERAVGV
ncbi:hypothetical protein MBLNU457_g0672t1 [Dothideomycetes sp. NU457]